MNEQQSIYQAILDAPEDDTPRLVYADWLADRGSVPDLDLADFIRAQCRLAADGRHGPAGAANVEVERLTAARLGITVGAYTDQSACSVPALYRRGFVAGLAVEPLRGEAAEKFCARVMAAMSRFPVQGLVCRYSKNLPMHFDMLSSVLPGWPTWKHVTEVDTQLLSPEIARRLLKGRRRVGFNPFAWENSHYLHDVEGRFLVALKKSGCKAVSVPVHAILARLPGLGLEDLGPDWSPLDD